MDPSLMPSRKSFERVGKLKYSLSQLLFALLTFKDNEEISMKITFYHLNIELSDR
jgi:hypothetical protein